MERSLNLQKDPAWKTDAQHVVQNYISHVSVSVKELVDAVRRGCCPQNSANGKLKTHLKFWLKKSCDHAPTFVTLRTNLLKLK